jgi:hypothetical protein
MLITINNFNLVYCTRVITALTKLVLLYYLIYIFVRKVYFITLY